jgi:hypothetical protein
MQKRPLRLPPSGGHKHRPAGKEDAETAEEDSDHRDSALPDLGLRGLGQVLPRACFPLLSRVSPRGEAGLRGEPGPTAPLAFPSPAPGIAWEALLARFFWRVTYIMPDVKSSGFSSQP